MQLSRTINFSQCSKLVHLIRILIVDDDIDIIHSLRDVLELEEAHFEIAVASSVAEVKTITQDFMPDIALLDIKLGNDNGLNLIPILKQINPNIVCIMMTAYRDTEYAISAIRFGAKDYIQKPINPVYLINTLNRHIENQQLAIENIIVNKQLEAIFEQSFQWAFLIDSKQNIIEVNQTALSMFDLEKSSILNTSLLDSPWFRSSQNDMNKLKNLLANVFHNKIGRTELKMRLDDGLLKTYDFSIKPVFNEHDQIAQAVAECRDITDRIHLEQTLKELNENLEEKVIQRTQELKNRNHQLQLENQQRQLAELKLLKAKEQADIANQAKSHFLSRMSHQFRTPLNAILGFAQLLQHDNSQPLNSTQLDSVAEILNAGHQLLALINDVLEIADLESGKFSFQMEMISLEDVLSETIQTIRPMAEQFGVEIELPLLNPHTKRIYADRKFLKQVILNLLNNAVKYSRPVQPRIKIYCETLAQQKIRITIEDNGVGISPEKFDTLFTPLERIEGNTNIGFGIGLAICKSLTEAMNAQIGFESHVGQGSRFFLTFNSE
ncbi:MAG: response regulator [Gammaproteobacteria bacterium]|nr:response regulator [Gammaproteobacteria bacterium]MDH5728349.1 response regulator [Gammaproteobacteria bacterium]